MSVKVLQTITSRFADIVGTQFPLTLQGLGAYLSSLIRISLQNSDLFFLKVLMIKMMNLFSAAEWISIEMKILHGEKIDLDEIQERKLN